LKNQSIILSFNSSVGWSAIDRTSELPNKKGVFETFRLDKTPHDSWRGVALQRHFQRYLSGCRAYGLEPISFENLVEGIRAAIKGNDFKKNSSLRIRLETIVGSDSTLVAQNFKARFNNNSGAKLISIELPRKNFLLKYLPATESNDSYQHALSHLADESLLINKENLTTETSWGNFVVISKTGSFFTSSEALPGITLSLIKEILLNKVIYQSYPLNDLYTDGSSAFLCNSLHGVIPVISIDGIDLPQSTLIHEIKEKLKEKRSLFEEAIFF
jgi:branched-subunit amino acid aminotransferase/4-amino-4-deoxychorismate lyase